MDILKIRKKAKRATTQEVVDAWPETPPEPETAPPQPAPPAATPDEAPSAPPRPTPATMTAEPAEEDPLREFLARYDLEEDLRFEGQELGRELDRPRYLAFSLGGEEYAASIMDVREILRVVSLTEVPRAPQQILGVLSKRGVVMPIVDLAAALGLRAPLHELTMEQRVLVVGEGAAIAGLRVDELHEVVEFQADDIEEVPASLGARSVHLLRGLGRSGDRMYILLEIEEVLASLKQAGGGGELLA